MEKTPKGRGGENVTQPAGLLHGEVTEIIRDGFFHVYNSLGTGFLEKVYENALALTLQQAGLTVRQRVPIKVYFEGKMVGVYEADILVNQCVIVEAKAVSALIDEHEAQLLNYLRATQIEVGLLVNFGPKPEFERRTFSNPSKVHLPKSPISSR
jgi:GxxExxY protein